MPVLQRLITYFKKLLWEFSKIEKTIHCLTQVFGQDMNEFCLIYQINRFCRSTASVVKSNHCHCKSKHSKFFDILQKEEEKWIFNLIQLTSGVLILPNTNLLKDQN